MDIYEALKAGKTPEEMKRDFEKQLTEAVERKRYEEAARAKVDEVRLTQLREKLIDALDAYCQKAYGAEPMTNATREFVEEMYKAFEKDKRTTVKKRPLSDDDILHRWFQSLI